MPFFTAIILLEPEGSGTRYTAIAMHTDEEGKKKHQEMGFLDGWGTALDQLVQLVKEHSALRGGDGPDRLHDLREGD